MLECLAGIPFIEQDPGLFWFQYDPAFSWNRRTTSVSSWEGIFIISFCLNQSQSGKLPKQSEIPVTRDFSQVESVLGG
ncbi:hypothetical protein RRG08_017780 [Elysia crispata]|uniref:Uncharacterized protein n=1 Tax=Elysia crispata TaxID=231223 RepID=A0AAE0YX01_9GAST|nr:hypothetical protein RRG08_017780 [Elysia crispata]